ncbi:MAG TPA: PTS galactitol transporter subunit IIB [Sphaerochaeta sp.]|jgi:PTS system nitrogen regulatory IIA component|nr:PTS galactitol transporter subunit IIB [Sphaerochaeta sp.]
MLEIPYLETVLSFVYSDCVDILNDCQSVICQLQATDKTKALVEVIDSCSIFQTLPDVERFKRGVLRRERIQSTGIGHGVAIAHGKILGIHEVHIALGISGEGIEFGSEDGMPVHLLFVIASSPAIQMEYLRSLSAILRSVHSETMRAHLLSLKERQSDDHCHKFFSMMESQEFVWFGKNHVQS